MKKDRYNKNRIHGLDDYSIELYIGEKRSGKTLGMTGETYEMIKDRPDIKVFANYHLNKKYFPNSMMITQRDMANFYLSKQEFKNAIFLIDEIQIFMDARKFAKKENQNLGYFLGQMGKRGNIFRGTTHFPNLIDLRLRAYCERWIYIRKGLLNKNGVWKPILNNNRKLNDQENDMMYVQMKPIIRKLVDYNFHYIPQKIFYIKGNAYYNMYDTEELIFIEKNEDEEDLDT